MKKLYSPEMSFFPDERCYGNIFQMNVNLDKRETRLNFTALYRTLCSFFTQTL